MTATARRATPPPLRAIHGPSSSGVRSLAELLSSDAVPSLRHVSMRTDSMRLDEPISVEFVQDCHFVAGLSEDFAAGGVFVATYRQLGIGTRVHLGMEFPNGHMVEASGVVRWMRGEGMERPGLGILFTEISNGTVAAIAEFCRLRPPLYFEL